MWTLRVAFRIRTLSSRCRLGLRLLRLWEVITCCYNSHISSKVSEVAPCSWGIVSESVASTLASFMLLQQILAMVLLAYVAMGTTRELKCFSPNTSHNLRERSKEVSLRCLTLNCLCHKTWVASIALAISGGLLGRGVQWETVDWYQWNA